MLQVRPLASSSAANATLLEHGTSRLLLDAGLPYRELQRLTRHAVSSLDGVLVTHEHGDHARGVRDLLTRARVDVYATRGTLDALDLPEGSPAHALQPLTPTRIGAWTVVAFPVRHDAAEPCGFLARLGDARVLYVTDAAFTPYRTRGLTHVLVEANHDPALVAASVDAGRIDARLASRIRQNHASLDATLELLSRLDLSRTEEVWLMHLSDGHSDARAFRDAVERQTGVPTRVAGHAGSLEAPR